MKNRETQRGGCKRAHKRKTLHPQERRKDKETVKDRGRKGFTNNPQGKWRREEPKGEKQRSIGRRREVGRAKPQRGGSPHREKEW